MAKIQVRKEPDGWRAIIKNGKKVLVLEDIYDSEGEAIMEAAASI